MSGASIRFALHMDQLDWFVQCNSRISKLFLRLFCDFFFGPPKIRPKKSKTSIFLVRKVTFCDFSACATFLRLLAKVAKVPGWSDSMRHFSHRYTRCVSCAKIFVCRIYVFVSFRHPMHVFNTRVHVCMCLRNCSAASGSLLIVGVRLIECRYPFLCSDGCHESDQQRHGYEVYVIYED